MSQPGVTVGALLAAGPRRSACRSSCWPAPTASTGVITSPHIQKTGLALAGFHEYLQPGRVLIFGESEVRYLESLDADGARQRAAARADARFPVRADHRRLRRRPPSWSSRPSARGVPLLQTAVADADGDRQADVAARGLRSPSATMMHGVLMDILGLGVLIVGESGIGKSECALDLVVRGHRLVADDTVEVRRRAETILIGTCPELTRHHMELRGLGVINIKDLFGIASTRSSKRVELVVQLERWDPRARVRAARARRRVLRDPRACACR